MAEAIKNGEDVLGEVKDKLKTWPKESIVECPNGKICYQYTYNITADSVVMKWKMQACLFDEEAYDLETRQRMCQVYERKLDFSAYNNRKTQCGDMLPCGHSCLLEEHKDFFYDDVDAGAEGLATFSLTLLLPLFYLVV